MVFMRVNGIRVVLMGVNWVGVVSRICVVFMGVKGIKVVLMRVNWIRVVLVRDNWMVLRSSE